MTELQKNILQYLRDEFQDDPDYSRKDLQDICHTLGIGEGKARDALSELRKAGKVLYFQDCNEYHDEWQASGARISFDDSDETPTPTTE